MPSNSLFAPQPPAVPQAASKLQSSTQSLLAALGQRPVCRDSAATTPPFLSRQPMTAQSSYVPSPSRIQLSSSRNSLASQSASSQSRRAEPSLPNGYRMQRTDQYPQGMPVNGAQAWRVASPTALPSAHFDAAHRMQPQQAFNIPSAHYQQPQGGVRPGHPMPTQTPSPAQMEAFMERRYEQMRLAQLMQAQAQQSQFQQPTVHVTGAPVAHGANAQYPIHAQSYAQGWPRVSPPQQQVPIPPTSGDVEQQLLRSYSAQQQGPYGSTTSAHEDCVSRGMPRVEPVDLSRQRRSPPTTSWMERVGEWLGCCGRHLTRGGSFLETIFTGQQQQQQQQQDLRATPDLVVEAQRVAASTMRPSLLKQREGSGDARAVGRSVRFDCSESAASSPEPSLSDASAQQDCPTEIRQALDEQARMTKGEAAKIDRSWASLDVEVDPQSRQVLDAFVWLADPLPSTWNACQTICKFSRESSSRCPRSTFCREKLNEYYEMYGIHRMVVMRLRGHDEAMEDLREVYEELGRQASENRQLAEEIQALCTKLMRANNVVTQRCLDLFAHEDALYRKGRALEDAVLSGQHLGREHLPPREDLFGTPSLPEPAQRDLARLADLTRTPVAPPQIPDLRRISLERRRSYVIVTGPSGRLEIAFHKPERFVRRTPQSLRDVQVRE